MSRQTFSASLFLDHRLYGVRDLDDVDIGDGFVQIRVRPDDDATLDDLYPDGDPDPDVVGLAVGEYVVVGGGAAEASVIFRRH